MPATRRPNPARLEFAPGFLAQANLSRGIHGDWLWVAGEDACGIDRLRRPDPIGAETLRYVMSVISLWASYSICPGPMKWKLTCKEWRLLTATGGWPGRMDSSARTQSWSATAVRRDPSPQTGAVAVAPLTCGTGAG